MEKLVVKVPHVPRQAQEDTLDQTLNGTVLHAISSWDLTDYGEGNDHRSWQCSGQGRDGHQALSQHQGSHPHDLL